MNMEKNIPVSSYLSAACYFVHILLKNDCYLKKTTLFCQNTNEIDKPENKTRKSIISYRVNQTICVLSV